MAITLEDLERCKALRKLKITFKSGNNLRLVAGHSALTLVNLILNGAGGLTHIELLRHRGGYRLAAYIHELRKEYNLNITDEWQTDNGVRFKRYYLLDKIDIISIK